jgi:hypothetical protein
MADGQSCVSAKYLSRFCDVNGFFQKAMKKGHVMTSEINPPRNRVSFWQAMRDTVALQLDANLRYIPR